MKSDDIFNISSSSAFNDIALDIFRFQYSKNSLYRDFVDHLRIVPEKVSHFKQIPFLPIRFFKSHKVITNTSSTNLVFSSSGTSGMTRSRHYVTHPEIYHKSFINAFRNFYGDPQEYVFLALLPSYLENKESSLIYMIREIIRLSDNSQSGFFLTDHQALFDAIQESQERRRKVLLFGVSFALLDFCESFSIKLTNGIVMETGGMKGRRSEMVRPELHSRLMAGFGVSEIHSEYGMTELLSQAYSTGAGRFRSPPWMKVIIREINDPLTYEGSNMTGGINVIDLANIHSCSFIATQDLGRAFDDGSFEVLGRFDNSDIRGCNLLAT